MRMHPTPPTEVLSHDRRSEAGTPERAATPRPSGPGGGMVLPKPAVKKIRGPKLVLLWAALIALSWVVVIGAGYGLYRMAGGLF